MKFICSFSLVFIFFLFSCQMKQSRYQPYFSFFVWGFSIEGFPITKDLLERLNQETKISSEIVQFYLQWPSSLDQYQSVISSLESIASEGAVPCITWEPMTINNGTETMILSEDILQGQHDDYLMKMVKEIKDWNRPLIIRFAHEMNLERYHWGGTSTQYDANSPDRYIQIFQYVVNFFKRHQVHQIFWAFCPNVDSIPNTPWNTPRHYYPGDEYVDILGMDGYNWDMTQEMAKEKGQNWTKPWLSFEQLFGPLYQDLKTIAPHKPILVFETSSVERKGGQKGEWIQEAILTAKKWNLLGILWFQIQKEEDWRINQNGDSTYLSLIRSATNPLLEWMQQENR